MSSRCQSLGRVVILSIAVGCLLPAGTSAQCITLQNDGFFTGQQAAFQVGFAPGEIGAAVFSPPGPFPQQVKEVQFLFGDTPIQRNMILRIWNDTGADDPGAEIFSNAYTVTGSAVNMQSVDLSLDNVTVTGPFRVGIEMTLAGLPSIARDADGTIDVTANYLLAEVVPGFFAWFPSNLLGLTGDWIIRALVPDDVTDAAVTSVPIEPRAYPNPFSAGTALRFSTTRPEQASVTVFDVSGRVVRTLASGWLGEGQHSIAWDGRSDFGTTVPSGVYFLRLEAGGAAHTQKVVRLRP